MPALILLLVLAAAGKAQGGVAHKLERLQGAPVAPWTVSLGAGPFRPRISGDAQNQRFFALMFEEGLKDAWSDNGPMLFAMTLERVLPAWLGPVGAAVSLGRWAVSGRARVCADADGNQVACDDDQGADRARSRAGNTATSLTVIPLRIGALWRIESLQRRFAVPVVPYARIGLDYDFWWARANGEVSKVGERRGKGATGGYHGGGGVRLALDWLDPGMVRAPDATLQGTYLYLEALAQKVNHFGSSRRLDFSDTIYSMGLALDIR
jgi:hypothetical protein